MDEQDLTKALRPGPDCASIEQLGRYADSRLSPADERHLESHLATCANCQAELALLHEFTRGAIRDDEREAVQGGVEQLRGRVPEILVGSRPTGSSARRWLSSGRLRPALALAVVLLAIVGGYYLTNPAAPRLPSNIGSGVETTRSLTVVVQAPVGDQTSMPDRLRWRPVEGATRYHVRVSEVDRLEIWSGDTADAAVDLPREVRARIAPGKTLVWQVTAYGASNTPIAESNAERFRLVR